MSISSIAGYSFTGLNAFGLYLDTNSTYYIIESTSNKIFMFDENWNYLLNRTIPGPSHLISSNNMIYISAFGNIFQTDKNLNIFLNYTCPYGGVNYAGIYHNATDNTVFAVSNFLTLIHIFDQNLTIIDSINLSPYNPYSLEENNDKLYVGTSNSDIIMIQNRTIICTFKIFNGIQAPVNSIKIDMNGYMAVVSSLNIAYLYNINGSYTGLCFAVPSTSMDINFDSKGRCIIVSTYQISIYI